MANAKIISIIDHEVAAALRLTAKDLTSLEAELRQASLDARDKTQRDLAFVADNLRNEIHSLTTTVIRLRHDHNTLAAAVNQLRVDVDQLKPGLRQPATSGKQGGATPQPSD